MAEGEKSTALGEACQSIVPSESLSSAAVVSAGGSSQDTVLKPLKPGDEGDNNGGRNSKRRYVKIKHLLNLYSMFSST